MSYTMSEKSSSLELEIQGYLSSISSWKSTVNTFKVVPSRKGVIDRFIQDCDILHINIDHNSKPSTADLVDFSDRHRELEKKFLHLVDQFS